MTTTLSLTSLITNNRITSTFSDEFLQDEIIGKTYFNQELSKLLNQNENSYETIVTTINDKEQSILSKISNTEQTLINTNTATEQSLLSTIDDNTAKFDAIGNLNDFFNAMNNAKI